MGLRAYRLRLAWTLLAYSGLAGLAATDKLVAFATIGFCFSGQSCLYLVQR